MTLELSDCVLFGPALPEPFVHFELEAVLGKLGLLSKAQDRRFEQAWDALRRQLRHLGGSGGPQRVCNHVIVPLAHCLGYGAPSRQDEVSTREGLEDGGWLMQAPCGARLRAWSVGVEVDLDSPHRSGRAYRFSPTRSAQRVLLAGGERAGLLTNGDDLRLLLCDPARPDSHVTIPLAGATGWRARNLAPDSYRVLWALAAPNGLAALAEVLDAARLNQTRVTKDLRLQARNAIEGFLQAVLDHPSNRRLRADDDGLAARLWQEGLILIYRLLFVLKLETTSDPGRAFSFASAGLWRDALSPNRALGPIVRRHLDQGTDTGRMLEDGLRLLFQVFRDGLSCSELSIAPLGGALFGAHATPLLDGLAWGERAVALLLDRLLWAMPKGRQRERVHYGSLDVEDLGRVYETLLELEPGITTEPMARLRRAKLEVVLPLRRAASMRATRTSHDDRIGVTWVEDIAAHRFFLRAGLGRKTTGSYYTPHAFVRFLVRETLAPQIRERSPDHDPNPAAILSLKVVDPATGSGHFLVEACRFLGEALYAACRLCDEQAEAAEHRAAGARPDQRVRLLAKAEASRRCVADLPDPDGTLLAYLPSRAREGGESGVSQSRALAVCRRLVAVHCLYGVDRNMLAVELAKLSLWLESYGEGLPLTFLDHRLVRGDSLAGPFLAQLATLPVGGKPLDPLLAQGVAARLDTAVRAALGEVRALQATLGRDAADLLLKEAAKARLDATLAPLRKLARAWSGAVMLATREGNDEWLVLAHAVAATGTWPCELTKRQTAMLEAGNLALPWDLTFPEVFIPDGIDRRTGGFDTVLSNPPWDIMQQNTGEFLAGFDLSVLDAPTKREALAIQDRVLAEPRAANAFGHYQLGFQQQRRLVDRLYRYQKLGARDEQTGAKLDSFRVFAERKMQLAGSAGAIGMVVPSAFHANEGATRIRRLYLRHTRLEWCLSFENRRKLFDIHASFKFALVVARRPGPTRTVRCAFYLTDVAQIEDPERLMDYDAAFIGSSGGMYATLLELRGAVDLAIARRMFRLSQGFGAWAEELGILLSREAHMTDDASRFTSVATLLGSGLEATDRCSAERLDRDGYLVLHEGKTIHQFSDRWHTAPRYAIALPALTGKPQIVANARYFRAACREIARSTDERTAIAAILPPGVICGHTINVERRPSQRPNATALTLVAVMNSFAFDWMLRQKAAAHVSLYILTELPSPVLSPTADRFLAHASLRLSCNHRGFLPLWLEQLGEASKPLSWPAVPAEQHRWRLRAAMDATIANAYSLDRVDYEHVLASFSHKSFRLAPEFCIAAFDELADVGIETFCRDHDPYFDIPLPTELAAPVIRDAGRHVA